MPLKPTPNAVLRFHERMDFIQVRHLLLRLANQTTLALVADLPSERLEGRDSPHDPLIMAQPDPEIPGEALMSVITRATIPVGTIVIDVDDFLTKAIHAHLSNRFAVPAGTSGHSTGGTLPSPHEDVTLTRAEFDALPEYSTSIPTGTTVGKRWKRNMGNGVWWMGSYAEHPDPKLVSIVWNLINITS